MYNTILFDLDGTLTDPWRGITNSVAYALTKFGIEVTDTRELCKFIGPPLLDSFAEYYGFDDDQCRLAVRLYREYFRDRGIYENSVYDGVPELLSALRGHGKRIVLATSKPEEFARIILKHFSLDVYFDLVAGASMDETRSKKADVIAYALEKLCITDTSDVLMVGDRKHDVLGANQLGINTVGVLYGYGDLEELRSAGARYIAKTVNDILNFI
ncbi:MAG: HAD family hydrolase [Clostridia bacterium]|nr:HAD family hydrolase [Clostridia bacterium]